MTTDLDVALAERKLERAKRRYVRAHRVAEGITRAVLGEALVPAQKVWMAQEEEQLAQTEAQLAQTKYERAKAEVERLLNGGGNDE